MAIRQSVPASAPSMLPPAPLGEDADGYPILPAFTRAEPP